MKKVTQNSSIIRGVIILAILLTNVVIVALCLQDTVFYSPSPEPKEPVALKDYFVLTNKYADNPTDSLASAAVKLHYYDFDSMLSARYGQFGGITCAPIESSDGSIIYDYGFNTKSWHVELCTLIEDQKDTIRTWIYLADLKTGKCVESVPEIVDYRIGNYVQNLHRDTDNGDTHLFQCERKTFVDFLALLKKGALDEEDGVIPFYKVGLEYNLVEEVSSIQNPAQ